MIPTGDVSLPPGVWQHWLRPRQVTQVQRIGGGFSGARLFRCHAAGAPEDAALRCWPHDTDIARVAQIHHVIQHARQQDCDLVPVQYRTADGLTVTRIEGRCWELAQWRPGRPFGCHRAVVAADLRQTAPGSPASIGESSERSAGEATIPALRAAAAAVARFHLAVADLASSRAAAPAIADRLRRIEQLDGAMRQPRPSASHWPGWLATAAVVAAAGWAAAMPSLRAELAQLSTRTRPLQYVLRDVHREHVLFEGLRVSGLIDFDALRIDTPATDLARLVASFASDLQPPLPVERLWEAAEAGYRSCRPLSEEDWALARLLGRVTPLISLANWVVWVGLERREFEAGEQRIAARVEHLSRLVRRTCIPAA